MNISSLDRRKERKHVRNFGFRNANVPVVSIKYVEDEQNVNGNIDEDLENVLIQIDILADQGNTEICPEYSFDTHTTVTANLCIATVPTVSNSTQENIELVEDKQFDQEFLHLDKTGVQSCFDKQQNKNTAKQSYYDLALVNRFLRKKNEIREIQTIPVSELDSLLYKFVPTVRKKVGQEYEPSTIRGLISSVERKLWCHKYGDSIMGDENDESFHLTRQTLKAKQKLLKQKGKGNKHKRAKPLTDGEISMLFDMNIWGDVTLNTASDGTKYLELNERQTKTRTGANVADVRELSPKIFETKEDRGPIN
ncbi:unnamed protein product [Mytilus coruscus]|uniref:Uncharacterized protein n=1 Tax=Mytilus coruscus TaxID=42192 RepID=A0A6J8EZK9_MYTCO|nr:unnamed protein product [Mytilus coruscus]